MKNLKKKFTVVLMIFTFVISLGTISGTNDNLAVVYANQTVYITKLVPNITVINVVTVHIMHQLFQKQSPWD